MDNAHFHKNDVALYLNDGSIFHGISVAKKHDVTVEMCFNTSMTGYQEIITDPSYANQALVFTCPHIGNVGANSFDVESKQAHIKAIIIREIPTEPSNFRSNQPFLSWLEKNNVVCIAGVDTRALAITIRKKGVLKGAIYHYDEQENISSEQLEKNISTRFTDFCYDNGLVDSVSSQERYISNQGLWSFRYGYKEFNNPQAKIAVIDYGVKKNILRHLNTRGLQTIVFSYTVSAEDILQENVSGVLLSNGPGDPATIAKDVLPNIKKLIESDIPILGICLGHQLLSLALGCKTKKMKQGHRGSNHPVQNLSNAKVYITSQNHGYVVDDDALPDNVEVTYRSLFDRTVQGIKLNDKPVISVQGHPEASSGPHDFAEIFDQFCSLVKNYNHHT